MGVRQKLRKLLRRKPRRKSGEPEAWQPVKDARRRPAFNRAGRLVLRGDLHDREVKLYEAANCHHAAFISFVTQHPPLDDLFPSIVETREQGLIVDWVSDDGSRPSVLDLARIQVRIHQTSVEALPDCGFDYWHDLIWPRFQRAAALIQQSSFADHIHAMVTPIWNRKKNLLHPDMTPANIVGRSPGWVIIDNEYLTLGGLPLLDVCNTAFALGQRGQEYLEAYMSLMPGKPDEEEKAALNAAWLARRAGTSFANGDLRSAKALIEKYEDSRILPFRL
jgi:hypothetical protein